ncbi:MAG TPA: hypothetical protein VMS79_03870 [Methanomassiliicoccales archaeon]|jgi:uncharacterized membrane protein (DUF485 family)|nr:hypothetical protein [Methanomassiliicoccales archaeon]
MSLGEWFSSPLNRARFLRWGWIVSLIFMAFGFVMIAVFWNTGI